MKNGSDRLLGSQVMEWNALRMRNTTSWKMLSCHVKWTHVLAKRQLESRQRQLGKTAVVKGRAYIVSSLILRPLPFFVLQFVFSIIHGSGRHSALPRPCTILNANRRTKNRGGLGTRLYCVCGQKDNRILTGSLWNCLFWKTHTETKLSIAMHSHISLTWLWVQAYSVFIVPEPGNISRHSVNPLHV